MTFVFRGSRVLMFRGSLMYLFSFLVLMFIFHCLYLFCVYVLDSQKLMLRLFIIDVCTISLYVL